MIAVHPSCNHTKTITILVDFIIKRLFTQLWQSVQPRRQKGTHHGTCTLRNLQALLLLLQAQRRQGENVLALAQVAQARRRRRIRRRKRIREWIARRVEFLFLWPNDEGAGGRKPLRLYKLDA